jgi:hypothetical protein
MKKLFLISLFLFTLTSGKAQSNPPQTRSQEVQVSIVLKEFVGYTVNQRDTSVYRYVNYKSFPQNYLQVYGNVQTDKQVLIKKRDPSNKAYQVSLIITPK